MAWECRPAQETTLRPDRGAGCAFLDGWPYPGGTVGAHNQEDCLPGLLYPHFARPSMSDTDRFQRVIRSIDEANREDPSSEVDDGVAQPKELLYGMRMQAWVERLDPRAPEALRIAARSQHIRRWEIPRSDYPMDRKGYLRWRTTLYAFHADRASELLQAAGYGDETIQRVRALLQKRNLRTDADVQTLEDAAALVFLEHHLDDFLKRDDIGEEKAIDIIRKTWKKMTDRGHGAASALELSEESSALLELALS